MKSLRHLSGKPTAVPDSDTLAAMLAGNPELLAKVLMSIQSANTR